MWAWLRVCRYVRTHVAMRRASIGNGLELMRVSELLILDITASLSSPSFSTQQMTIYVFFPVAVFYYFNMPEFFERFVAEKRVTLP